MTFQSASTQDSRILQWLRPLAIALITAYIFGISAFLLREGSWPTPDFLIPPLVLIAILFRRGWSFVLDWLPFLLLLLSYEAFRGIADDLNSRVHVEELVRADKWLAGGVVPTVYLQQHFFDPAHLRWYDWATTGLHAAHFAAPVVFGFILWLNSRAAYWRFALTVLVMFYAGFVTYYLYPAAPPWMAADLGLIPHVDRVIVDTLGQLSTGHGMVLTYHKFSANDVAALPSLHAAMPALLALIAVDRYGRRGLPLVLYPLIGGLAWIYIGEHYLIDVLVGWLYALASFLLVWKLLPVAVDALRGLRQVRLWAPRGLSDLRPLPAWPLGVAVVVLALYVWDHPLVSAPLATTGASPAGAPLAGPISEVGMALNSVDDLGVSSCETGSAAASGADISLGSLAAQYAGFIQAIDSRACLSLTAARWFDPLSEDDLRQAIGESVASGVPDVALPTPNGPAYVVVGPASEELARIAGVDPGATYAVVVRVDTPEREQDVRQVVAQIARLVLTIPLPN